MNYPLDPTLSAQAQALVAQMTLAEKADFCSGKDFWHLPGLERLQVPSIMVTDGPHGLRKQGQGADHLGAHRSIHRPGAHMLHFPFASASCACLLRARFSWIRRRPEPICTHPAGSCLHVAELHPPASPRGIGSPQPQAAPGLSRRYRSARRPLLAEVLP